MPQRFTIVQTAKKTYRLNLINWLPEGTVIAGAVVASKDPDDGIAVNIMPFQPTYVDFRVSTPTPRTRYRVTLHIIFSDGDEDDFAFTFDAE